MKVILVSPGQTDWSASERVKGALDVPLNARGVGEVESLAARFAPEGVTRVYCPTTLDGTQTAKIIARITKAKVCPRKELNEAHPGLWQGLTAEELKRRHPHVYARWVKSPASVRPPRGEAFTMIFGRVQAVTSELKRHRSDEVVVCVVPQVVRQVLAGLLRGTGVPVEHGAQDSAMDVVEL